MGEKLRFVPMEPWHGVEIRRQPSQRLQLGLRADLSEAEAAELAKGREAWAALASNGIADRIVAIGGIVDVFPGTHGALWATLSDRVGKHHLEISRYGRLLVERCPLGRLEAIVEAPDVEALVTRTAGDAGQLIELARLSPTPEMRWAEMSGLKAAAVLRRYGAAGQTHMLYERIR
jgi:hypothetical protein